jgi:prephenate dehydrogenase
MNVAIVGLGLIGGSIALDLKEKGFATRIIGVDTNEAHQKTALKNGLVDEIKSLEQASLLANLVVIAAPVNITCTLLPSILDLINSKTIVMDVGSTKEAICKSIEKHPNRRNFVASHPMAGTEYSGPEAAFKGLFVNKVSVICEKEKSAPEGLHLIENLYQNLGMRTLFMGAEEHDIHTAYISHLSHAISFALASTVLKKEKNTSTIFDLASSGFQSTVRLAKSSSSMWTPIFEQNSKHLIPVLGDYIAELMELKQSLENNNSKKIDTFIKEANEIKKILH